jgi:hypothetical protein
VQQPGTEPLVDVVSGMESPAPAGEKTGVRERAAERVGISFRGGRTAYLDLREPRTAVWADVLASLLEAGRPAYVEIEPRTSLITALLIPARMRVLNLEPDKEEDGFEVHLAPSQARHLLRRSHPRFEALRRALEEARKSGRPVLVTDSLDGHEIVDVRPAEE